MGDIIFTAKKIVDQSPVATWIADGGDLLLSALGVVSQRGDAGVDLLIGEVPEKPVIEIKTKCIAQFRPKGSWKGKFGFDWYRLGDTSLDGDVLFDELVGQYYDKNPATPGAIRNRNPNSWTKFFQKDPQPEIFANYNRLQTLKSLYGSFNYTFQKDGKAVTSPYYIPRLALFSKKTDPSDPKKVQESGEAELVLQIEHEKIAGKTTKPLRLQFEMDGLVMDEKHPLVSISPAIIGQKDMGSKQTIKITCKADFAEDKDIEVWAVSKNDDGTEECELAGRLKMIAPAKKKILDVVIVRVKTRAGTGRPASLDQFKRNLKQALVQVNEVNADQNKIAISLDLTNLLSPLDFNTEYSVTNGDIKNTNGQQLSLEDLLTRELEVNYPGQFTSHFKLFFFSNSCQTETITDTTGAVSKKQKAGYSNLNKNFGVLFSNHDETTIGHECMHGLGLHHSFFGERFVFKALKTENIMDYSGLPVDTVTGMANTPMDRVSTYYWQWKIINPKLN